MGKRKKSSRKPAGPKKKEKLPTVFQCLFCNHEKAVTVKLEKKAGVGQLSCKVCGQHFQTGVNFLSEAVDVYSDWIDACEEAKTQLNSGSGSAAYNVQRNIDGSLRTKEGQPRGGRRDDILEDDFIVQDEGDMEADYGGG